MRAKGARSRNRGTDPSKAMPPRGKETLPPIRPQPNARPETIAAAFERNLPGVLKKMGQTE